MKKTITIILIVCVIAAIAVFIFLVKKNNIAVPEEKLIRIGISMDTLKEDRWKTDRDLFTKKAEELGVLVTSLIANGNDNLQISQIENLISQKVDVIVVIAHNAEAVAPAMEEARKANIKTIAYDRLVKNSDIDLYISFDSVQVGELEAQGVLSAAGGKGDFIYIGGSPLDNNSILLKQGTMNILEPKIKTGEVRLVFEKFTDDWNPEIAYKNMKDYLKTNSLINGVIAANDGTAYGVIKALAEFDLAGKIPVSGQDAELSACQRIIKGTQTMTVYKPIRLLAEKAAELAVSLAKNQKIETNSTINNGKSDIPSYLIDSIPVTKDNMDETVLKDGYQTREEIYNN
jgi:D-xylose transport system substrate-binding protein